MIRIVFFLLLVSLTGCSITGRYYLRNLTNLPATVTVVLNENVTFENWNESDLLFDDKIREIKFGIFKKFDKKIKVQAIDQTRVAFIVPPKSTVFIGYGLNTGFWGGFQQAVVRIGDTEKSIDTNDQVQMNLRMRGLMKYTAYYDISL